MADDEIIHDNNAVVDRPSTPAEETALGEARAKLASMTGKAAPTTPPSARRATEQGIPDGPVQSTKDAAALAAREAQAPVSETAQRVRDANRNPALWDEKNPDHAKARKELREAIAADISDEERDALANEDVSTLRSRYGITDPRRDLPHPELRAKWDTESEAVGLATLAVVVRGRGDSARPTPIRRGRRRPQPGRPGDRGGLRGVRGEVQGTAQ